MVSLIELSGDCPCPAPILRNDVLSVLKIKAIIIDEGYCLRHYFFFFFFESTKSQQEDTSSQFTFRRCLALLWI